MEEQEDVLDGFLQISGSVIHLSNIANKSEKIEGKSITGGIVGLGGIYSTLIINNSYNQSKIISTHRESGGIIGDTDANTYCVNTYNIGEIKTNIMGDNGPINGSAGGIIGSSYGLKSEEAIDTTKIHIINSFNIGNIISANYSSGIFGRRRSSISEINIRNVYNKGNLTSEKEESEYKYGIVSLNTLENSKLELKNAFYIGNVDKGTNYEPDESVEKTEDEINTEDFVNTLNEYVDENPTVTFEGYQINLLKWKAGDKGYPVIL